MRTSLIAIVLLASIASAAPPRPLDLARALRESGHADLALEYLADLTTTAPPEVQIVIPLERALTRLEQTSSAGGTSRRATLAAQAKADFDAFLAAAPDHPRRAEAAAALARLVAIDAKAKLVEAVDLTDADAQQKARAEALRLYQQAGEQFASATGALDAARASASESVRKQADTAYLQARLDQAINQYQLAQAYPPTTADGRRAKTAAILEARKLFTETAAIDPAQPISWVALAWAGECDRSAGDPKKAQASFDAVQAEAKSNPVAAAGAQTAAFFGLKVEYEQALLASANRVPALRAVQGKLERWLRSASRQRADASEVTAARFYVAYAQDQQARALIRRDPKTEELNVPESARALLRGAARDYRSVVDPPNEYSARASEFRGQVVNLLVGDITKAVPERMQDYELVLLTAQTHLGRAINAAAPDEQAESAARAAVFYDRLATLSPPDELSQEAQEAAANRVFALVLANRPLEAAVLGEFVARTGRGTSAPRAGLYAVQAYRQAGNDPADQAQVLRVTQYLDQTFPSDPATDSARLIAAQQLLQMGQPKPALDLTTRIGPTNSVANLNARFLETLAAVECLRPDSPHREADPAARTELIDQVLARLGTVPAPDPDSPADQARTQALLMLQRAELNFLRTPPNLTEARAAAAAATQQIQNFNELPDDVKLELSRRAELTGLRAAYGQALTQFQEGQFAAVTDTLAPTLTADRAGGSGTAPADLAGNRLDEFRREKLIPLAIQARLRDGTVDQIPALIDLLPKFGGSLTDSPATIVNLLDNIRPQLNALRKSGQAETADQVAKSLGELLDQAAANPNLQPATILAIGRGLRELGDTDKAMTFLNRIPAPANPDWLKSGVAVPEAEAAPVARYRLAQLELARAHKEAGRFTEADGILNLAANWTANTDFKRETVSVLEARAAAAPPAERQKLWGEAYKAWTNLANQYANPLRRLAAGKTDPKAAVVALVGLNALPTHPQLPTDPVVLRRGLAEATPPAWLTQLLADPQYVEQLKTVSDRLEGTLKPQFHDLLAESYRCLTLANESLLKGDAVKLRPKYDAVAKSLIALETANPDLAAPVRFKLATLFDDRPELRESYLRQGGKLLASPADQP